MIDFKVNWHAKGSGFFEAAGIEPSDVFNRPNGSPMVISPKRSEGHRGLKIWSAPPDNFKINGTDIIGEWKQYANGLRVLKLDDETFRKMTTKPIVIPEEDEAPLKDKKILSCGLMFYAGIGGKALANGGRLHQSFGQRRGYPFQCTLGQEHNQPNAEFEAHPDKGIVYVRMWCWLDLSDAGPFAVTIHDIRVSGFQQQPWQWKEWRTKLWETVIPIEKALDILDGKIENSNTPYYRRIKHGFETLKRDQIFNAPPPLQKLIIDNSISKPSSVEVKEKSSTSITLKFSGAYWKHDISEFSINLQDPETGKTQTKRTVHTVEKFHGLKPDTEYNISVRCITENNLLGASRNLVVTTSQADGSEPVIPPQPEEPEIEEPEEETVIIQPPNSIKRVQSHDVYAAITRALGSNVQLFGNGITDRTKNAVSPDALLDMLRQDKTSIKQYIVDDPTGSKDNFDCDDFADVTRCMLRINHGYDGCAIVITPGKHAFCLAIVVNSENKVRALPFEPQADPEQSGFFPNLKESMYHPNSGEKYHVYI